jgi:hypothetical protein
MTITEPRAFTYFVHAEMFSVVDATGAVFGSVAPARVLASADPTVAVVVAEQAAVASGEGCRASNSIVLQPKHGFPGGSPGNC